MRISDALLIVLASGSVAACNRSEPESGQAQQTRTSPDGASDSLSWKAVDHALGRTGKALPGDVYKYSMPRSDLRVTLGGVTIKPALALGSWLAFKRVGREAVAMGDLVLTTSEVAPVLGKLQELGVEPSALHNHLLHESPAVMYMHIHARGDPVKIAGTVRQALTLTKTPSEKPSDSKPSTPLGMDTTAIAQALGQTGKVNGGVYQVSVPRAETIQESGMEVPPSMGVATAINFQPTAGRKAAVTGDFVMTAQEVNPVLRALSGTGITVTALHNHMLNDEPRLFFAHFWGNDDAVKLALGLRSALDKMHVKRGGS